LDDPIAGEEYDAIRRIPVYFAAPAYKALVETVDVAQEVVHKAVTGSVSFVGNVLSSIWEKIKGSSSGVLVVGNAEAPDGLSVLTVSAANPNSMLNWKLELQFAKGDVPVQAPQGRQALGAGLTNTGAA
jgi:hypothetical protein